jgi:hypothetical protein
MHYFYTFLIAILNAFICAHYAKKRGRNAFYWFVGGAFFGLFAVVALFLLPSRKADNRTAIPKKNPMPLLHTVFPEHNNKLWYYLDQEKKQCGPMSFDALGRAWNEKRLDMRTLVWNDSLEHWKCFDEVIRVHEV